MPQYKRNRKKNAVLIEEVNNHKAGDRFLVTNAGERHGELVYHCYSQRDGYVGILSSKVFKVTN